MSRWLSCRVRAVLLWQGEADARARTAHRTYETLLRRFVTDVVAACGARVVTAQIGDYGTNWYDAQGVDAIRLAQQDAWGAGQGVLPGPVLYDIDPARTGGVTSGMAGIGGPAAAGLPAGQIAQPKRPCFSKYFW